MEDLYPNFAALAAKEKLGSDYRFRFESRDTPTVILAPHGGSIERGTSEIAEAIAREDLSIYVFEGLRPRSRELHITSTNFDEPHALELIGRAETAIAIHGRANNGDRTTIGLGGLNTALRDAVASMLKRAGFDVGMASNELAGLAPTNICNRGVASAGVQLELPRALRNQLVGDRARLQLFGNAVREAISGAGMSGSESGSPT